MHLSNISDSNEYCHKFNANNPHVDNNQLNNTSVETTEERIGAPDEFDRMIQRYQQKHSKQWTMISTNTNFKKETVKRHLFNICNFSPLKIYSIS